MVFPWIPALFKQGIFEVAREEMLAYWESQGKLKTDERQITANGVGARYIVTNGKDGYVVGAGFSLTHGTSAVATAELRVDGTVVETIRSFGSETRDIFENLGYKIDGDGAKQFDVNITGAATKTFESWIQVVEVDDAGDIRIYNN